MNKSSIASHCALALTALALTAVSTAQTAPIDKLVVGDQSRDDSDGDGVDSTEDNCSEVFNPVQIDSDGDGIGNWCDADLNNDCIVNVVDLGIFRSRFFTSDADADFNGNGSVNVVDLGILRTVFFSVPGPSGEINVCNLSVAASGDLDLNRSLGFDLDEGLQQSSLSPPVDIWYQALSATAIELQSAQRDANRRVQLLRIWHTERTGLHRGHVIVRTYIARNTFRGLVAVRTHKRRPCEPLSDHRR